MQSCTPKQVLLSLLIVCLQAKRREERKAAMKARTKEAFLQSQAHVFYTEPAEPRAGESVRVFYNPNNTVLHGRERVWMRGSFNRWTHRTGCWQPIQMEPAPNGTHLMAEGEWMSVGPILLDSCVLSCRLKQDSIACTS